jgi:hypothetical protein
MGERRYSSTILDLGTGWRGVISFTLLSLCLLGKGPPGKNWIGGWVGPHAVEKRKILPLPGI